MTEVPEFIERLVNEGIEITLKMDKKFGLYFDLDTQAKSHLHLYKTEDGWLARCRYWEDQIEDFDGILSNVHRCLYGRDFMNQKWLDLLVKEGYLERVVQTSVSYR